MSNQAREVAVETAKRNLSVALFDKKECEYKFGKRDNWYRENVAAKRRELSFAKNRLY